MKISDILKKKKLSLSFEIFPPKQQSSYESVIDAAMKLCSFNPDFMSITYGAGGSTKRNTVQIAHELQTKGNATALAHLTCVGASKTDIASAAKEMAQFGIENVLALRGDIPQPDANGNMPEGFFDAWKEQGFAHASDLVAELKKQGDFCVGGACYPEGHPESYNRDIDIDNVKYKVEAGCDFLTTQMFFDNDMLYSFLYRLQSKGIHVPVLAGIMPITQPSQIKRMIKLSNAYIPRKLLMIVDRFQDSPEALMQAGIAYATDQIIDLISNGVRGIHIYTMNKPNVAEAIVSNINSIVKAVNA